MVHVLIDRGKCSLCKLCIQYCPAHVFTLHNDEIIVKQENCTECYACIPLCPEKAIDIIDADP
ncbi:MAG: 4Fe-4S dicluster domain-containing protein [Crenarchaeota archaeon]|nr:4Fe-4S dicluster domain-containing protein [Thermoproteota archaeon]